MASNDSCEDKFFCFDNFTNCYENHKAFFENQERDFSSNSTEGQSSVKGRLKNNCKSLGASDYVIQVIEKGYVIPFIKTPTCSA